MPTFTFKVETDDAKRVIRRKLRFIVAPMRGQVGRGISSEMKGSALDELAGSYWQQSPSSRSPWAPLVRIPGQKHRKPFGGRSGTTAAAWRGANVRASGDTVTLTAIVPGFHVGSRGGLGRSRTPASFVVRDRGHQQFLGKKLGWWPQVGKTVEIPARPMASSMSAARFESAERIFVRGWERA